MSYLNLNSSMSNIGWIIDTGATTPICACYEQFKNLEI